MPPPRPPPPTPSRKEGSLLLLLTLVHLTDAELRTLLIDCLALWGVEARITAGADRTWRSPPKTAPSSATRPGRYASGPLAAAITGACRRQSPAARTAIDRCLALAHCATHSAPTSANRLRIGASLMKQDERGLALSTDSEAAATSFDRAVEHYLKFHADTMVLAAARSPPIPISSWDTASRRYLLLMAANPANRAQIDATLARAQATRRTSPSASGCTWPPPPPGTREPSSVRSRSGGRSSMPIPPTCWHSASRDTIWFRHGQTQSILRTGRPCHTALVGRSARL